MVLKKMLKRLAGSVGNLFEAAALLLLIPAGWLYEYAEDGYALGRVRCIVQTVEDHLEYETRERTRGMN